MPRFAPVIIIRVVIMLSLPDQADEGVGMLGGFADNRGVKWRAGEYLAQHWLKM